MSHSLWIFSEQPTPGQFCSCFDFDNNFRITPISDAGVFVGRIYLCARWTASDFDLVELKVVCDCLKIRCVCSPAIPVHQVSKVFSSLNLQHILRLFNF